MLSLWLMLLSVIFVYFSLEFSFFFFLIVLRQNNPRNSSTRLLSTVIPLNMERLRIEICLYPMNALGSMVQNNHEVNRKYSGLSHSLAHLLVCSHRSLLRLLCSTQPIARSFVCLLAPLTPWLALPLARPFACLLALHTPSLGLQCSLRSRTPRCSFVCSLTPDLMGK